MEANTTRPPTRAPARLVRPRDDRVVVGVCGGLGRYFGIDPVILRLVMVLLVLFGGTGLLAYVIAWMVIPEEPRSEPTQQAAGSDAVTKDEQPGVAAPPPSAAREGVTLLGVLLIVVGVLVFADRLIPGLSWRFTGPVVLVAIGVLLLTKGGSR